jgi:hypothetical protein
MIRLMPPKIRHNIVSGISAVILVCVLGYERSYFALGLKVVGEGFLEEGELVYRDWDNCSVIKGLRIVYVC